jgi:signal transduction histidine kinase
MARRANLRLRIAVALAAVCIGLVGVLGATLLEASRQNQESLVEQIVGEEMESLIARIPPGSGYVATGPNLQYYVVGPGTDEQRLPASLRGLQAGQHNLGSGGERRRVGVREAYGHRYVVVYDAGQHELREASFRRLLLLSLGVAAFLAVLLGYWVAGVLARQLSELAARVARLSPEEPHPPLEQADHDREVAAVAHALDEYHDRIVDMIRREQQFTSNVSHELRTPLTGIQTSCELLAADPSLPLKSRERVRMIDLAARQMAERVESLLYLARRSAEAPRAAFDLRACVEEALQLHAEEAARKGLRVEVDVPAGAVVTADRKALQIVLSNLVKNAVRYTEKGRVRVSWDGARIAVADTGIGIDEADLAQVFERYHRVSTDSAGLGLGLSIVKSICASAGWDIEVSSAPGRGSAFSVRVV